MKRQGLESFYRKRYFLFSKFDSGVKIDKEGWYSVTPEPFSKYLAERVYKTLKGEDSAADMKMKDAD